MFNYAAAASTHKYYIYVNILRNLKEKKSPFFHYLKFNQI